MVKHKILKKITLLTIIATKIVTTNESNTVNSTCFCSNVPTVLLECLQHCF